MPHPITASVIVLGYNGKDFLAPCLAAVLDQSYPADDYEVIYADNGSIDGSVDLVGKSFPGVRVHRFDRNWGFAEGNNRAAALARGRYLLFLNQDTVVHRHWLAGLVAAMDSDPRVKAGYAAVRPFDAASQEREKRLDRAYFNDVSRFGAVDAVEIRLPDQPIATLHVGGGTLILDRQVVDELDYIFDPRFFAYCEDLDLGVRLNGMGCRVVFIPTAICFHRREERTRPTRKTLWRLGMATRNRFLTYMKNMYADEFLLTLPFLFVGSIVKMNHMVQDPLKQVIYSLGLLPFTAFYLVKAALQLPGYMADRRRILERRSRHHDRHWLRQELAKRAHPRAHGYTRQRDGSVFEERGR
jgi:GT2 family glycosyltransferase